jgi:putative hemolysin
MCLPDADEQKVAPADRVLLLADHMFTTAGQDIDDLDEFVGMFRFNALRQIRLQGDIFFPVDELTERVLLHLALRGSIDFRFNVDF